MPIRTSGAIAAVDRAAAASAMAPDEDAAVAAFRKALQPEWGREKEVEAACAADPSESHRGQGAFAALERLRVAEETSARRRAVETAPLRQDVRAYLPP